MTAVTFLVLLALSVLSPLVRGATTIPTPAQNEFHFAVLGDSQFHDPATFNRMIDDLTYIRPAFVVQVGDIPVRLLHTPGHTPGSQCFLVGGKHLVSGDTLFVQGCGRVDLPGGDPDEMYRTLTQRLSTLPDDMILMPGHNYGGEPSASLGEVRRGNPYLRAQSLEDWRRLMGGA